MFAIEDLPAGDAASAPDLLDRMFAGDRLGVIVRGALPADAAADILAKATAGSLPAMPSDHYAGMNYGPTLIVSGSDLRPYFATAGSLAGLSGAGIDVEARLAALLGSLASGRPPGRPRHANGSAYAPLGLRMLTPGGTIDLHCENETVHFPSMRDLGPKLDGRTILSFYTPIALPDAGGDLEVYPMRFGEPSGADLTRIDRRGEALESLLQKHSPTIARPVVGDVLIFDAGRHYHRVTPVIGARARWTLGGFAALSADRRALYLWN